jgi:hypothetical protein
VIKVGDLVRYDPSMFRDPTLTETHSLPFGWLRDDFEGTEPKWIGVVAKVDPKMWGTRGGLGYEVLWNHGYVESVYAFEIEKVVDEPDYL